MYPLPEIHQKRHFSNISFSKEVLSEITIFASNILSAIDDINISNSDMINSTADDIIVRVTNITTVVLQLF